MKFDFDLQREPVQPRDAATLVLVRACGDLELEVFCVERSRALAFMGGAIVFPGGKLDPRDRDPRFLTLANAPRARGLAFAPDPGTLGALAIAACRESLEEAAILPVRGGSLTHEELAHMRAVDSMADVLAARGLVLDLEALHPLARWVTPVAESRRFDARFFLAVAPEGQTGVHDSRETMSSFWASPTRVLARFEAGEVQLAPPTHRTLELLAHARTPDAAIALADSACLDPICPRLVRQGDTVALVLPGDPEHEVSEARVAGKSRYVLRDERFVPEDVPR